MISLNLSEVFGYFCSITMGCLTFPMQFPEQRQLSGRGKGFLQLPLQVLISYRQAIHSSSGCPTPQCPAILSDACLLLFSARVPHALNGTRGTVVQACSLRHGELCLGPVCWETPYLAPGAAQTARPGSGKSSSQLHENDSSGQMADSLPLPHCSVRLAIFCVRKEWRG